MKNKLKKAMPYLATIGVGLIFSYWWSISEVSSLIDISPFAVFLGVAIGLTVYVNLKKDGKKKMRAGREHGSARWGRPKDIEPFKDENFKNDMILTETESMTINSRPSDWTTARNKNVLVTGGSGQGKTRFFIKPNLLNMAYKDAGLLKQSAILTDSKGTLLPDTGYLMNSAGFKIKILNLLDFLKSMRYNPFAYIYKETDILVFVNALIENTMPPQGHKDFWVNAEILLYQALIGYIMSETPEADHTIDSISLMIDEMEVREDDGSWKNAVDFMFEELAEKEPGHFAVRQYKKYKHAAGKTAKSILISCGVRLSPFDIKEVRDLMSEDELELDKIGTEKTILYIILSDTDKTFNFIAGIMYTQLFNILCNVADNQPGGRLPRHVRMYLDEFANTVKIPDFEKIISVIRSREISAAIMLQAKSQLKSRYKDDMETIIGNMDSEIFLGGKEDSTLKSTSEKLGKETIDSRNTSKNHGYQESSGESFQKHGRELMTIDELAVMPKDYCVLSVSGLRPFFSKKYDVRKHENYKYTADYDEKYLFDAEKHIEESRKARRSYYEPEPKSVPQHSVEITLKTSEKL